jgi:hypothetical protein
MYVPLEVGKIKCKNSVGPVLETGRLLTVMGVVLNVDNQG